MTSRLLRINAKQFEEGTFLPCQDLNDTFETLINKIHYNE